MKIGILGAGAMGCLYGGLLSGNDDNRVYLVDIWKDHMDAVNEKGLIIEEKGKDIVYSNIKGCTEASQAGECDLVIVFVKSTMTKDAVLGNKELFGSDTAVLTLQNGMGNMEIIEDVLEKDDVVGGTTAHGATMLGPGKIRHAGEGLTVIGQRSSRESRELLAIRDAMENVGIKTEISDNVVGLMWDKLLVNVGINGLTAITGMENGKLLDYGEIVDVMQNLVNEAAAVAKVSGVKLGFENPAAHAEEVAAATGKNRSSMLQDIEKGRKTEIDMINGAVVRKGKEAGIATPYNEVITALVKCLENEKRR